MKLMPNINFSQQELTERVFTEMYSHGGEAYICLSDNPNTLFKIFFNPQTGEIVEMSDNKLKKITALYQKNIAGSVKPLSTISMDGRLVGYEMSYDQNDMPLNCLGMDRKDSIDILKRTKEILQNFDAKDITYGDVKDNNILVNIKTSEIKFCDMDNIRLGQYPIDLMGVDLRKYYEKRGTIDGATDAYMHNLMSLKQLKFPSNYTFYSGIILMFEQGMFPSKFKLAAQPIFESMINPEEFTGEYAIQYIKR